MLTYADHELIHAAEGPFVSKVMSLYDQIASLEDEVRILSDKETDNQAVIKMLEQDDQTLYNIINVFSENTKVVEKAIRSQAIVRENLSALEKNLQENSPSKALLATARNEHDSYKSDSHGIKSEEDYNTLLRQAHNDGSDTRYVEIGDTTPPRIEAMPRGIKNLNINNTSLIKFYCVDRGKLVDNTNFCRSIACINQIMKTCLSLIGRHPS